MASLSIVNFSGRLFDRTAKPKEDGLLVSINYNDSTLEKVGASSSCRAQGVSFNDVGDQFIISDTRG